MKSIAKLLSLAVLTGASISAHAITLAGTINMSSNAYVAANITNAGVTFDNVITGAIVTSNQETTTYGTGDFSALNATNGVEVDLPGTILISSLTAYNAAIGGVDQGLTLFTFTSQPDANGLTHTFRFQAFSATQYTQIPGYSFFGFLEEAKGTGAFAIVNTNSTFTITNSGPMTNVSFSSNDINPPAQTPEPNSLILLGTGLISAAGIAMRKRRLA